MLEYYFTVILQDFTLFDTLGFYTFALIVI